MIIQRRQSQKSMCMFQRKSLKCLTTMVWFQSSLQVKNKFLAIILMFLMVLDAFLVHHIIFRWIQCHTKTNPCWPIPLHLKEALKKEIDQMLQAGVLNPVNQAIPWINSFVLVEGKDKQGNFKLRICLDPINLNKAIVWEPYWFQIPEDIAHLFAEACVITVCDYRKRLLAPAAWWNFFIFDHL